MTCRRSSRFAVFSVSLRRWKVTNGRRVCSAKHSDINSSPSLGIGFVLLLLSAATLSPGRFIDLVCLPDAPRAGGGAGSVHHIAFRAKNDEEQRAWREQIVALGYNVSPVMDRTYFHSIYFREPGGVLFEIATDAPGFTLDESPEQLGGSLRLPPWLEKARTQIEEILPPITLPLKPAP